MMVFLILLGSLGGLFHAGAVVMCILACVFGIAWANAETDAYKPTEAELKKLADRRSWFFRSLYVAVPFICLAAAIPTRRDIAEAYALSEASKLATAENVSKVADEVLKRVDTLLGKL